MKKNKIETFIFYLSLTSVLVFGFFLSACQKAKSSVTSGTQTTSTDTSSISISASTCTTAVIDFGQKGNAAATSRGIHSDMQIIPGTNTYVTAFADPNAVAVKISYWNGTNHVIETVSGEGSGAFVRLAFLSTGQPFVFWASGTRIRAASRSAPLSSSDGVWTGATVDTTTAPRALEVSVSPLDDIALSYLTDTAATGRVKIAFCTGPCLSASGFQTMTPNAYIENTNIIAAGMETGVAWCKASSSIYYPSVVYPLGTAVRYATCQNTINNCLSSTNWSSINVAAVGSVGGKLYLDSSIVGDVPKVMAKNATGVAPYQMGSTACTSAPAVFTAGANLTTSATAGTLWMSLLKTSNGKFHLATNNSTTDLYYYNSNTTTFNGAWNSPGIVETTTFSNPSVGGAAIDSSTNSLYFSYGVNAANFDVKIAKVNDYTTLSSAAIFSKYIIDNTGQMILGAASQQRKSISIRSTSAGRPVVAYVDTSIGATAGSKLKYAFRNGNFSTSSWTISTVPGTSSPQYPSLALDENNKPWISFFDAGNNKFILTTNTQSDGSGTWTNYEFPSTPAGAPIALPAANNTAMAMHVTGSQYNPVMIVIDNNATTRGVKSAKFLKSSQTWTSAATIDAMGASGGSFVSADFNNSGELVVAYYEHTTAQRVRYAYSANGTSWSTPITVASANGQGMGAQIRLHSVTGKPAISFYDRANNTVIYSSCANSVSGCATAGWGQSNIDIFAGVSGLTTTSDQLLSAALSFTSSGLIEVFYARGSGNDGGLVKASSLNGSLFAQTVIRQGSAANMAGIAALNFGVSGWSADASRNSSGNNTVVYIGPGNYLYSTSCGD